jgi:hypothetical protein
LYHDQPAGIVRRQQSAVPKQTERSHIGRKHQYRKAPVTLISKIYDWAGALLISLAAPFMRNTRFNLQYNPRTKAALLKAGVLPIIDHFYEPLIDPGTLRNLDAVRSLPAIDFNIDGQIAVLNSLSDDAAVNVLFEKAERATDFILHNGYFENGDADLWFRVIQHFKPRRIIEIGSGHSTKVARLALDLNRQTDGNYHCDHTCIDPNAPVWLDQFGPKIIRQKVEDVGLEPFAHLKAGDILFIDSSHVIRPQGDVLFEYLEILPSLAPGVLVHLHDIFTPHDYPADWLQNRQYLWNEQYLLEAFLGDNKNWEILLGANMLMDVDFELLRARCPSLDREKAPRSFYIRRVAL